MSKFNLTIECDDADELAALLAKINGKCTKQLASEDSEQEEKPAKKAAKEDDDEKPAKKAAKEDAEEKPATDKTKQKREKIRDMLRDYSEKTDRKTAVKFLNKTAESVDDIPAEELDDFIESLETKIETA